MCVCVCVCVCVYIYMGILLFFCTVPCNVIIQYKPTKCKFSKSIL